MPKVLIVEDSKVVSTILKNRIEVELQFDVKLVTSFSEAKELLDKNRMEFFLCLVGLYLPDAPGGEIVDYVISKNLPTIVFTSELSEDIRTKILSKKIIDYVYKETGYTLGYVVNLIKRVYKNKDIKVLVVDDSKIFRTRVCDLLEVHKYNVFGAGDGNEALKILGENPDIKMIITDYNMPGMDGLQLIKEVRIKFNKEDLSIIGMSGDNLLSARFIKHGANDFFSKDFFTEEFYCRVNQNIEIIEHIKEVQEASIRDYLTNIHNRRYFYDVGRQLFENSKRNSLTITTAMLDVDFFKKVNDQYGHDAGDLVLKKVASILQGRFRASDIVARIGGEEFCVLACNMGAENTEKIFQEIRETIANTEVAAGNEIIKVSVSIGICNKKMDSLDDMVKYSDQMLYKAKNNGRNRVEI
ncbi:MAG: diguanylate cyclase [Spirochaetota bacterium]